MCGALVRVLTGTEIDLRHWQDIARRKPGRKGLSMRTESDECEILSGVLRARLQVGQFLLTWNSNAKSKIEFSSDHPRPGHADLPESSFRWRSRFERWRFPIG